MIELTTDAQATLLLCSHVGTAAEAMPAPLTLREWNQLVRKLLASPLSRPSALLGLTDTDIQTTLSVPEAEAARLALLLSRGGALAIELERLASLGIWVMTRADDDYPPRFRQRLKESAPVVLFGSGERSLLGQSGLAVVGSRHIDDPAKLAAEFAGNACARSGLVLYSGAARGVDALAMGAALEAHGPVVGVLADSLEKAIRAPDVRAALERRDLALVTSYSPTAGFSVGAAMGRNKLIYTLADYALVIASDVEKGGTWVGAIEALKARWVPVFILNGPDASEGNRRLIQQGGQPFPFPFPDSPATLKNWLSTHAATAQPLPTQVSLF